MTPQTAPPQREPGPGRVRRALARVAAGLGLGAVFAGATAGGLALHLDTAAARRVAREVTNDALGALFQGRVVADEIDALSLRGVRIRSAVALDPRGGQAIRASGIEARADVARMLYDVLFGAGDLRVEIPYIRVEHADVLVETSPAGGVTIGEVFTPRPPKKPQAQPSQPSGPRRAMHVALPHIEIGRGWVHGRVAPPRALDADVNKLVGAVFVGPEGVAVDVQQTGLLDRAFLPVKTAGTADYHLRAGKKVAMWTTFAGHLGDVELTARWEMNDGHMAASGNLPRVTPAELSTLVPGHPFTQPVSAHVEIEGAAPSFEVRGELAAAPKGPGPGGSVALTGRLDVEGPLRLEADASARALDLRVLGANLPEVTVTAEARVRGELGSAPTILVDARTEPTRAFNQAVPAADVHVVLAGGELSGTATLHEDGMPIEGAFTRMPDGGVRFVARSEIPSIARAPRIAGTVDGSARVRVEGTVRGEALEARFEGAVGGLRTGSALALGSGRVEGRLRGPLDALEVDASLSGSDLRAGEYAFEGVRVRAAGKLTEPRVEATLTDGDDAIRASGRLSAKARSLRGVEVAVRRDGQELSGSVARIGPGRGGLEIQGAKLQSDKLGAIAGDLAIRGDDLTGSLRAEGVDLDQVARVLGLPQRVHGIANLDVAVTRGEDGRRSGKLLLELEGGEISLLTGVSAHIAATLDQDRLVADGLVRLMGRGEGGPQPDAPGGASELRCGGTIASVRLSRGEGTLAGPLLRAETWAGLTGSAEVAAEDWDLGCIAELVPGLNLVLSDVRGKLTARAAVARAPGDRFPSLKSLVARTQGLELAGPQGLGDEHPAWESRFIDGQLKGSLDGKTGRAEAALTLYDGELLGDLALTMDLDLPALTDRPGRLDTLRRTPITGKLSIPRRSLPSFETLPTFLHEHLPPLAGEIRLDAYANGTLERPLLALRARGFGVSYRGRSEAEAVAFAFPTDVDALVTYDSQRATLDAHVSKDQHEIATVTAEASAALDDLLRGAKGRPLWTGGFEARLDEVPLGELPLFGDIGVGGHLNGVVAMSGLGKAPTLKAELDVPDLKIGDDLFFERGALSLHIQPRRRPLPEDGDKAAAAAQRKAGEEEASPREDTAIARVELVTQEGGRLDASAFAGVTWQDGLVPAIDGGRAADLFARAERFRLAAAQPLAAGVLSRLDGYLDGDLRIGWLRAGEDDPAKVEAEMQVSEGVVHIPVLGQELREATLRLVAKDGILRLEKVSAAGITGRLNAWALARLNGLKLRDAAGAMVIQEGEAIPLTLEGVPFGTAHGALTFTTEARENELAVVLRIPSMHLQLPETSTRAVQPLEDNPEIEISHPLGPEREGRSPDALRYALTFDLGELHVEGSGLDVRVAGQPEAPPRVVIADETRTSGNLVVTRGQLEVLGKRFEIERALVRLREEEASNPYLNATAHWDAPDGTRIYVDYTGLLSPITDKSLRFRSNPPRSQKDILARLLFDADAAEIRRDTSGGQTAGGMAAGVGGEIAAAQFNTILKGIAPLRGLSTKVGTTSEGTIRTTIVYELDDELTAGASYEGAPSSNTETSTGTATAAPGGAASQRTGRTEISVDWRFLRNWTLRGTVGVGGTQSESGILDLLWQYRY